LAARFDMFSESFDLLNVDFRGGVAWGLRRGHVSAEAFVYHQSSHLGDEILERGARKRIDYAREVARVLAAWRTGSWRFYSGPAVVLHSQSRSAQGDLTLHLGAEFGWSAWGCPMFAALDLQLPQEHHWEPNLTARMGLDLGDPALVDNRQFVFVELFRGHSNLGQYYDQREAYALLGVGFIFR
jgi:hypothetical protein